MCWRCVGILKHIKYQTRDSISSLKSIQVTEWQRHSRTGKCITCELIRKQLKGGRPLKRKRSGKGLPNVNITDEDPECCMNYDTAVHPFNLVPTNTAYTVSHKLDILGKDPQEENIFICTICQCILGSPTVQTPCEHNFCSQCLSQWFRYKTSNDVACPVCQTNVGYSDVTASPRILKFQLTTLSTVCTQCGTIGKLTKMASHTCPNTIPKTG